MEHYISVVIPVFNSAEILQDLYDRLENVLLGINDSYEIILVDDGSSDKSFEVMKSLNQRDPRVKAIRLSRNFGQQNAIMCGFHHAQGKYTVTMDDDLQNPPEEIVRLLIKIDEGYDVVYGIPTQKSHSFLRNLGSKMTDRLFNIICKKPKHVRVSSFRIMKRDIIDRIIMDKTSFVYISAMLFKSHAKIGDVFVKHDNRSQGESNYNFYKLVRLFVKLYLYYSPSSFWRGRSSLPQFIIKDKVL